MARTMHMRMIALADGTRRPAVDENGRSIWDDGAAPIHRRPGSTWPLLSRSLCTSASELPEIRAYERSMGVPTEYVQSKKNEGIFYPVVTGPQHQANLNAIHDLHNADGMRSSDHRRTAPQL